MNKSKAKFVMLVGTMFAPLAIQASAADKPTTRPHPGVRSVPIEPGDVAAPKRLKGGEIDPNFLRVHEGFLQRAKEGNIRVLFFGDFVFASWEGRNGKKAWDQNFAKNDVANFSVAGQRTPQFLWRIENGELDGIKPKAVVMMIGIDGFGQLEPEIIKGEQKIVEEIHQKLPDSKLLIVGMIPIGANPKAAAIVELREKEQHINAALAQLDDGTKTRFLDAGKKFIDGEGNLLPGVMVDAYRQLTEKGFEILADQIKPVLDELTK